MGLKKCYSIKNTKNRECPPSTNIKLNEYDGTWHIKDYLIIYPLGFHLLEYDDENMGDILVDFLDNGEYEIILTDVRNPKDELIDYLFPKGGGQPLSIEKNKFKRSLMYTIKTNANINLIIFISIFIIITIFMLLN